MGTLHAIIALVLALPLSSHHAFAAFPLGCSQVTGCLLSNPFQDDTLTSLMSTQISEANVLSNIKTIPPFLCQQGWSIEKLRVDLLIQKNCLSFAVYRSIEGREKTLPDYIFRQPIHIFYRQTKSTLFMWHVCQIIIIISKFTRRLWTLTRLFPLGRQFSFHLRSASKASAVG